MEQLTTTEPAASLNCGAVDFSESFFCLLKQSVFFFEPLTLSLNQSGVHYSSAGVDRKKLLCEGSLIFSSDAPIR